MQQNNECLMAWRIHKLELGFAIIGAGTEGSCPALSSGWWGGLRHRLKRPSSPSPFPLPPFLPQVGAGLPLWSSNHPSHPATTTGVETDLVQQPSAPDGWFGAILEREPSFSRVDLQVSADLGLLGEWLKTGRDISKFFRPSFPAQLPQRSCS